MVSRGFEFVVTVTGPGLGAARLRRGLSGPPHLMPKRNVVILVASVLASLIAWAARERGGHGHRFGELLTAIERHSMSDVDVEQVYAASVMAAVAQLDEHSAYLPDGERAALEPTLDQTFTGVGLELSVDPDRRQPLVEAAVFAGPAWRSDIESGDWIEAIDGTPTSGLPLREVVARLRGPVNTPVRLRVASGGRHLLSLDPAVQPSTEAPRELVLIRETVEVETVEGDRRNDDGSWDWMLEGERGLAYVRIDSFGERTAPEFTAALDQIAAIPDLTGLILDLRANPGGLIGAAVAVCDALLEDGVIVEIRGRPNRGTDSAASSDVRRATPGAALVGVPIAILVDGLTASAAETVAACLQDAGRATVVGSRTLGKGTVQSLIPLSDGRGVLKLTTAEYVRPTRESIHRGNDEGDSAAWGVRPDPGCEVTPTAEAVERIRHWRRSRISPSRSAAPVSASGFLPREIDAVLVRGIDATRGVR